MMKTYSPKAKEITRDWVVIDAAGVPLGRLASQVAQLLRGKHKPTFAPHLDTGDHVIVVNAEQVVLTGAKLDQKMYYRHSGYPGGFRAVKARDEMQRRPIRVIERAVKGMLPHTALGTVQLGKLRVYPGPDHPHAGQVSPGPGKAKTRRASSDTAAPVVATEATAVETTTPATTSDVTPVAVASVGGVAMLGGAAAATTGASGIAAQTAAAQETAAREAAEHPEATGEPTEAGSTPTQADSNAADGNAAEGDAEGSTAQGNEEATS
jgi:large subunit ribosomal protein L13